MSNMIGPQFAAAVIQLHCEESVEIWPSFLYLMLRRRGRGGDCFTVSDTHTAVIVTEDGFGRAVCVVRPSAQVAQG